MATRLISMGAALLAVGLAAPLAAQSVDEDVRCLLVSNAFARTEKDPAKNQIAKISAAFYLGRLDMRMPSTQLKGALLAQAKAMTPAAVAPVMNGCVRRLLQKSGAMGPANPPAAKPR